MLCRTVKKSKSGKGRCGVLFYWLAIETQGFALLKIVPDDFLFAAFHGAHP
jgi:hypothetical protein